MEPTALSSPRISFSADFLEEKDFISICPADSDAQNDKEKARNPTEFEFLSGEINTMITADELFFEGKLLPFWEMQLSVGEQTPEKPKAAEEAVALFLGHHDDDPSPRLPKCTVLWKELMKLKTKKKKENNKASSSSSSLSPSSSTSSSSSSSSGGSLPGSLPEQGSGKRPTPKTKVEKEGNKSAPIIRVRPVINVPICTPRKSTSSLSPLFALKKGNLEW